MRASLNSLVLSADNRRRKIFVPNRRKWLTNRLRSVEYAARSYEHRSLKIDQAKRVGAC